jgi:hypothetical protein
MDGTVAWETALATEAFKPDDETTRKVLESMTAYVNDSNMEKFCKAGDVEAQLRNFHALKG